MKAVNRAVIYVTRDIERALGQTPSANYIILTNSTTYSEEIREKYPDFVFTFKKIANSDTNNVNNSGNNELSTDGILDTYDLLVHKDVTEKILATSKNFEQVGILVFKNNSRIERAVAEIAEKISNVKNSCEIKLLNPSAELADKIEGKISQIEWLKKEPSLINLLPPHTVCKAKEIKWGMKFGNEDKEQPFVVQWNHGHTGTGTIFIEKEADISKNINANFAERDARVTKKINGVMYTTNGIVFGTENKGAKAKTKTEAKAESELELKSESEKIADSTQNAQKVIVCHTSLQITGMLPFTDSVGTTVGNDWALPHDFLSEEVQEKINNICKQVGEKMAKDGWLGLYGIDVIVEDGTQEVFLIEINARQSANISYESILQNHFIEQGVKGITTFNAHIRALFGDSYENLLDEIQNKENNNDSVIVAINDGAQIIQRVTEKFQKAKSTGRQIDIIALKNLGFNVLEYANTENGADALRIQSTQGIMERSHTFNVRGKEILAAVSEIYPL